MSELADRVRRAALLEGEFVLSSGSRSSYYIDKYLFSTDPGLLRELSRELASLIPPDTHRLAGVELGAVPLVAATSLASGLPYVIVRRSQKEHGTGRGIEGRLEAGEEVTLIEDVVTTGSQAIKAAESLYDAGVEVCAILAVLDRREEKSEKLGKIPLWSLIGIEELGVNKEN